jgi:exopolyphosphatase/guanosine-5'-triphosphate,3'-diphosphate pyrophosphatase
MAHSMQQHAAIIDLGTNTFKLLLCERHDGTLRVIHREEVPVYLGRGGIEQGLIAPDAFERGLEALRAFRETALANGVNRLRGFGTSALRNARNGVAFVQRAKEELDIDIRIIAGDEEAGLILEGVRQAVPLGNKPTLIMDIGGGSTEFILATEKALMWKRSFELGVTRLRERFPCSDPMTLDEETRIAQHLDSQLEPLYAVIERHEPHLLIGSAGSFDTLAAMVAADSGTLLADDATTLAFDAHTFGELKDRLMRMTREERLAVPGLPEHRVDTINYALVQIERVLLAGGIRDLAWSRYALKEGAASQLAV